MNSYTVTLQIDYESEQPLSVSGKGALRNYVVGVMQDAKLDVRIADVKLEVVDVNVEDVT